MIDIEKLKEICGDEALSKTPSRYITTSEYREAFEAFVEEVSPAAVLELIAEIERLDKFSEGLGLHIAEAGKRETAYRAEVEALRSRAAYWKQRAKSAEGHLYAGDMEAAMRELHKRTAHAGTPWEDLSVSQHAQIQGAALAVVGAINSQRDRRLPADSQETAHD